MHLKTINLIISGTKVISILVLNPDDIFDLYSAKYKAISFPYYFSKDVDSIDDLDEKDYESFSKIYYNHYLGNLDFSQYLGNPKD